MFIMEQKREYGLTQQEVFERQQTGAVNQQQKTIRVMHRFFVKIYVHYSIY